MSDSTPATSGPEQPSPYQSQSSSHQQASEARRRLLTETPVPQLILKLAVPTILNMLVTALYNAADTFFVGRISTEATAAVGLCF